MSDGEEVKIQRRVESECEEISLNDGKVKAYRHL